MALMSRVSAATPQACNIDVNVNDPHPGDTHVRDAPGGKVIAILKKTPNNDWIEAHVTGQVGDWFLIDRAWQVHVSGDNGDKTILFRGKGYMHKSVLGINGLAGGAAVYVAPDPDAQRLKVPFEDHGDFVISYSDVGGELLDCKNDWLHIRMTYPEAWTKEFTGWTRHVCLNGVTTCS